MKLGRRPFLGSLVSWAPLGLLLGALVCVAQTVSSGVWWRKDSKVAWSAQEPYASMVFGGRRFDRLDSVNAEDAEFDRAQLSKNAKARHVRRGLVEGLWPHLLQQKEDEERVSPCRACVWLKVS